MPLSSTRRKITVTLVVALMALFTLGLAALAGVWEHGSTLATGFLLVVIVAASAILVAGASSIQHDLDASHALGEALRQSEARIAGLVSIAADAIITVDTDQRITLFNHGAEEIFGYSAAEMIGRPLSDLLPSRFHHAHAHHFVAFGSGPDAARRMGERREILGLRKNGEEFPADASILKLEVAGEMAYTVVLRDVTERRRVEEGQRFLADAGGVLTRTLEYEAVLTAVAQLPVPRLGDVCVLDIIGEERSRRIVSVSGDAEVERRSRLIPVDAPGPDSASAILDVMRTKTAMLVSEVDVSWLEAHSETEEILDGARQVGARSMIIVPLLARGDAFGVMSILRLTGAPLFGPAELALAEQLATRAAYALENARLFQIARSATDARDDILGVVSHDLRNPVNAIGMCVRVLRESPPDEVNARRELVDAIGDAVDWMDRLIRDLLDVANLERGRLSVERHQEEVEPIVQSAISMFEHTARERNVLLEARVTPAGLRVDGDAARLVQVLSNLVANSLAHTERGGAVRVTIAPEGRMVRFEVSDTGSGIPAENLPHVFERHWRSSASAKRGGSGLGLAIARGIVQAHGGQIWVESEPGQGATFRFTVPAGEIG
jgi:PAS domain S-box-containing protein